MKKMAAGEEESSKKERSGVEGTARMMMSFGGTLLKRQKK
jgi:hypothetical protein